MPYQKLQRRQERLRNARLLLDLARVFSDGIYGEQRLGASLDGVFVMACVAIGHAENRLMTISKLALYLGMTRQTVMRRLNELIQIGAVERAGQYYYVAPQLTERIDRHILRANHIIEAACRFTETALVSNSDTQKC